jgi:cytochrome c553
MRTGRSSLGVAGVLALTLLMFTMAFATTQKQSADQKSNQNTSTSAAAASSDGERKFATHCGRCHNPPRQLSREAAPAVLRHMRVRAMLTEADEKAIIEFMAP